MGLLALVTCVFTLGFPWYFQVTTFPNVVSGGTCTVLNLQSWMDSFCYSTNCADGDSVALCPQSVTHWQSDCDDCSDMKRVFNISLALTVVSTFCALFVCLGFCIRCCSSTHGQRSPLHVIMTVVSIASLIGALVYFAIAYPKSTQAGTFWGNSDDGVVKTVYGPAGWVAGCVASLILLITLCMSCMRGDDETRNGSYYSMGEHLESQTQRHPHVTLYAAKSTYV